MNKIYAGLGSRETPKNICNFMAEIAYTLMEHDWILRSGGATGADLAFGNVIRNRLINKPTEMVKYQEIFLPWDGFSGMIANPDHGYFIENNPETEILAKKYHPVYDTLTKGAKLMMRRNCHQVLGRDLKSPAHMLFCYTADGSIGKTTEKTGGTGMAIRIAYDHKIPIFNLAKQDHYKRIHDWINKMDYDPTEEM